MKPQNDAQIIVSERGASLGKPHSQSGLPSSGTMIKRHLRYNGNGSTANKSGVVPSTGPVNIDSPKFEKKKSLNNDIETQEGQNEQHDGSVERNELRRISTQSKPQTAGNVLGGARGKKARSTLA